MVIRLDKKEYRQLMKTKLAKVDELEYKRKSAMIHNKVLNIDKIKQANIIALTIANFPEVDTKNLIEALWKQGKQVAIPKCTPSTKEMEFYIFKDYNELELVYAGLWEPIINETTKINKGQIDVLISPGIVFDKEGYRIGFGGGYYDRYLTDFSKMTISMAFEMQIVEKVPRDAYDLSICTIITEERIIHCNEVREDDNN